MGIRNPSDKSLGYLHTVPLGREAITLGRIVVHAIYGRGSGIYFRTAPVKKRLTIITNDKLPIPKQRITIQNFTKYNNLTSQPCLSIWLVNFAHDMMI